MGGAPRAPSHLRVPSSAVCSLYTTGARLLPPGGTGCHKVHPVPLGAHAGKRQEDTFWSHVPSPDPVSAESPSSSPASPSPLPRLQRPAFGTQGHGGRSGHPCGPSPGSRASGPRQAPGFLLGRQAGRRLRKPAARGLRKGLHQPPALPASGRAEARWPRPAPAQACETRPAAPKARWGVGARMPPTAPTRHRGSTAPKLPSPGPAGILVPWQDHAGQRVPLPDQRCATPWNGHTVATPPPVTRTVTHDRGVHLHVYPAPPLSQNYSPEAAERWISDANQTRFRMPVAASVPPSRSGTSPQVSLSTPPDPARFPLRWGLPGASPKPLWPLHPSPCQTHLVMRIPPHKRVPSLQARTASLTSCHPGPGTQQVSTRGLATRAPFLILRWQKQIDPRQD